MYCNAGVVHRDIVPWNILIQRDAIPGARGILIDFSCATSMDKVIPRPERTPVSIYCLISTHSYLTSIPRDLIGLCAEMPCLAIPQTPTLTTWNPSIGFSALSSVFMVARVPRGVNYRQRWNCCL